LQIFETLPGFLKDENKLLKKTGLSLSKHSNTRNWQFSEKLENHPTTINPCLMAIFKFFCMG
jgi:hypothetical protein